MPMNTNDLALLKQLKIKADELADLMWDAQQRGYVIKVGWDKGAVEVFEVHQMVPVHLEQQ